MCGICVYINLSGCLIDKAIFAGMTAVVAHRGPDDCGIEYFTSKPALALGHRRLSIIDLTSAGHQPMVSSDGSMRIVFNGEIYNYKDIRLELEARGWQFRSTSDTEVLLTAYQEWGERCLEKFNGMFGFAIWDNLKKIVFAARDRLGIKPLYYWHKGDTLILASEIKSILASGLVPSEPDWDALSTPWHYQISPYTGFKDIHKLKAGHWLKYSVMGLKIEKYWDIKPVEQNISDVEAVEQLRELIADAVRLQTIADVPVGAFLSGGLDSSYIVGQMSKRASKPVRTFTIRFENIDQKYEDGFEDSFYAREVASLFGCAHEEITIKPEITDLLPKIIWHLDEPLADPAAINTFLISKAAREAGVTVLLNGMGGDEVFGGYRKYIACLLADQYNRFIPSAVRRAIMHVIQNIPVADADRGFQYLRWIRHFSNMAARDTTHRFISADMAFVPPETYNNIFTYRAAEMSYAALPSVSARASIIKQRSLSYLTRMCLDDTKHFLPDHNLNYSDKATMAASVEGRPPLIDHRIIEFMFSLLPNLRIRCWQQKYLLKKSAAGLLPKRIINRPKVSFGAPLRSWIRRDMKEMIDDILSPSALKNRGLFNPSTVRNLIQQDRSGKEDNALLIWSILTREMWFKTFIDRSFKGN